MLTIDSVSKFYGQRQAALSNISLEVEKGDLAFLTGASGAGKSTLLRLLYAEEKPSSGNIRLGPFDFSRLTKKQIPAVRRHVGVVFQDFRLIPDRTAAGNIALALEVVGMGRKEISKKTDDALKLVGVWHKRNNYPGQLSGGEAQRVALARAVVNEPLVLLADEPTGNLDEQNSRDLFELFKQINIRGATIIVATHQTELARELGGKIFHLVSGTLQESRE
jgi:cell division transport system ATP-binding protein